MNPQQIARRQAAADQHDAAMQKWPDRQGAAFVAEMKVVLSALEALIRELPPGTVASLEWARTLRWYADALFDLGRGKDRDLLEKGRANYRWAELLLEGTDQPTERAKLQVSIANTLQGLAGTEDRPLLEEALARYQSALDLFSQHEPRHVPTVRHLMQLVQSTLGLMKAKEKLEKADLSSSASIQQAIQGASALAADAGNAGIRAVERLREQAGLPPAQGMEGLNSQLQAITAQSADPAMTAIFDMLRGQFELEVAAGKITPERAAALGPILRALGEVISEPAESIQEKMAKVQRVQGLMAAVTELARKPSHGLPDPPPTSRASALLPLWSTFRANLYTLAAQSLRGPKTSTQAQELIAKSSEDHRLLHLSGGDDGKMLLAEWESLRQHAAEARLLAGLPNLTLARPAFDVGGLHSSPNRVFFSGGAQVEALLRSVCTIRQLELLSPTAGEEASSNLWRRLCSASIAVFDFTPKDPVSFAQVAYELGLARVLGHPLVILSGAAPLPFDVSVLPLELTGKNDAENIGLELDLALYSLPSLPRGTGLLSTARELIRLYGQAQDLPGVPVVLGELEQSLKDPDPVAIRHTMAGILALAGPDAPRLLQPAWPASYPIPGKPSLFHVMPFGPAWSSRVSKAVRELCTSPLQYIRHDDVDEEQIIRSLWDEVSRADYILVDLTGWNANVLIELGFAHGLGKRCLLVAQKGLVGGLFPAIAKHRVHEYDPEGGLTDLQTLVERWLRRS